MASFRCPNCQAKILTLPDTPRARALLKVAGPVENVTPKRARAPRAAPEPAVMPTHTQADLDRKAVRRAIYARHRTDTAAAADEWARWEQANPLPTTP